MESSVDQRLDFGKMEYGMLSNPSDRHELVRHDVKQVICSVCDTEQQVARICSNCGVNLGEYFCDVCKFYDDDTKKGQFHCTDCGICRVGGRENFFHCQKCGSCYSVSLRDNHLCVENSMRHHCPICYEYLFDSLNDTRVLKCGHTMHLECYREMGRHNKYCCPICFKSVFDMSNTWKRIDEEIEATVMPEDYRYKKFCAICGMTFIPLVVALHIFGWFGDIALSFAKTHLRCKCMSQVWILCNDCNNTTEDFFHVIGQKCSHCKSYNTRAIAPPVLP
ncbi:hypothetical protein HHK36_012496 [Tetracentron sinense]|uniref:Uncharacterized protein n=1 Tax=Tetracentron sinense TaxID=13715 RepID=A0A835DIQ6_TETSI|nr:hypothetical protein HHK36_012496 [Tetracentron sinense]